MKKSLAIILLMLSTGLHAQTWQVIPLENYDPELDYAYFKDVNGILDKYVGTWEFNSGVFYYKVKFFKQSGFQEIPLDSPYKIKYKLDRIYGLVEFRLNGNLVFSTIITQNKDYLKSDVFSYAGEKFRLSYSEPSVSPCGRRLTGIVTLQYSSSGGTEYLAWNRKDIISSPSFCLENQEVDNTPFQVPDILVLTKIEE